MNHPKPLRAASPARNSRPVVPEKGAPPSASLLSPVRLGARFPPRTVLCILSVLLAASCATAPRVVPGAEPGAEAGYAPLYPGVEYRLFRQAEPRPLLVHVVRADLRSGDVAVRTPIAPDPDGPGPAEAILESPLELARASGAQVLVNASSFGVLGYRGGKRPPLYLRGMRVLIAGLAVDGGRIASPCDPGYAAIYFDGEGRAAFSAPGEAPERPGKPTEAAAGFSLLLARGELAEGRKGAWEPRTAAGLDSAGRLLLVVAEGRRKGISEGMTLGELALFMKELGCVDALNLDGGGSSVLLVRGPAGYRALTSPTDRVGPFRRHRPIPNALAIVPVSE